MLSFIRRFAIFRRTLDAEMKKGTRLGLGLKNKKEEKLPVWPLSDGDEKKFWELGLLGKDTAKSFKCCVLLQINGKLFGLRAVEHRNIYLNNFEIGDNYIRFE